MIFFIKEICLSYRQLKIKNHFILFKRACLFIFLLNFGPLVIRMDASDSDNIKDKYYTGDTIRFSGYEWVIKDSKERLTGPGKNYFSNSSENVWVDSLGKLHLLITQRNEKWYCSEVRLTQSLGYGRYTFYIDSLPQALDKDMVIGLFMYDHLDTGNFHKEVDIEFSKWGKEKNQNSQYVIQPYENQPHRFETDLRYPSKHIIEVRKRKLVFNSSYIAEQLPDTLRRSIQKWTYKPEDVYRTSDEKVSMNAWLYKASETASLKKVEVIISGFDFVPFKFEKHKPVLPKIRLFKKSKKKS